MFLKTGKKKHIIKLPLKMKIISILYLIFSILIPLILIYLFNEIGNGFDY